MLEHMDGILSKFNKYQKDAEIAKYTKEIELPPPLAPEQSARESDLVTLLNVEDYIDSGRSSFC